MDIVLKNLMELVVRDTLDHCKSSLKGCTCARCLEDIIAVTLNHLPPKYVVTRTGELLGKVNMIEHQFNVDIVSQIVKSNELVQKSPRH